MTLFSRPIPGRARRSITAATAATLLLVSPGIATGATDPDGAPAGDDISLVTSTPSPGWENSQDATARAAALLARMTLLEKVDMLHGELNNYYGFYNAPIERLGIPALTMADGPAGTRIANPDVNGKRSTELPSPMLMAAIGCPAGAGRPWFRKAGGLPRTPRKPGRPARLVRCQLRGRAARCAPC
jgi:beta-glucosidase